MGIVEVLPRGIQWACGYCLEPHQTLGDGHLVHFDPPIIGPASADPCCGVLTYEPDDSVSMGWKAKHPHDFATFSFSVVRGNQTVVSDSGPVAASSSAMVQTVNYMLNHNLPVGCPAGGCQVAGFSENLYVDSLATDGWSSELGYDASAVRAFVLSNI